jgi:hypothetical protein
MTNVVSLAGLSATDGARLHGDEAQMIFVAGAVELCQRQIIGASDGLTVVMGLFRFISPDKSGSSIRRLPRISDGRLWLFAAGA